MKNVFKIKISAIEDHGRNHDLWCSRVLLLRSARHPGDVESVNRTQLSALKRAGVIFEIL